MALYEVGSQLSVFNSLGVIPVPVHGVAKNFYVNRTPLFARLDDAPLGAMSFKTSSDNFRPTTTAIAEGTTYGISDTTLTVVDGSSFMAGDVIEIESETLLVTAISGNDLTVTRAYAGTTAATHADTLTVYLIGNTRKGNETEQSAIGRIPVTVTQNAQTFQHPYSIGGSFASASDYALPPGAPSILGKYRMDAMQNCADDIERTIYYGRGVAIAGTTTRPASTGLRSLITTNNTTSPTNASAYTPFDFIRDTAEKCYAAGGNPDTLIVSTNFMSGLAKWGHAAQRLTAGANEFGTPIDVLESPFLGGMRIIPAPLLRPFTAICLSSSEIRMRVKRQMFDKPRGSRGDALEGDILFEGAVELENESHHAWVTGITAFSA